MYWDGVVAPTGSSNVSTKLPSSRSTSNLNTVGPVVSGMNAEANVLSLNSELVRIKAGAGFPAKSVMKLASNCGTQLNWLTQRVACCLMLLKSKDVSCRTMVGVVLFMTCPPVREY